MRRTLLLLLAALATVAFALHARHGGTHNPGTVTRTPREVQPPRKPVDWPTYGLDPARTHATTFELAPPFRLRWKQTADWSLIEFPPVVADGVLYVDTNHGLLLAIDAASGRVLWRRELGRCTASSPAVAGDLLVVGVMAPPPHCDADVASYVIALDRRTGHTRWLYRTGPVESSPLVAGALVVFGSWDGHIDALAAADGRLRWSVRTNGPVKAGAALQGSTLYIGSYDGSLYAIDASNGRLRWKASAGAPDYATPSVAGSRVVVATTDGVVHAFSGNSGAQLWSQRIGRFAYSAAALAGNRAFVGSYDHRLYALDLRTGHVLWTHEAPGPISGAPTVLGGLVYFSSCGSCSSYESNPHARRTFAVDAGSGDLVWSFPDGEYSPVVTDGIRLYLTGYTAVYALAPAR